MNVFNPDSLLEKTTTHVSMSVVLCSRCGYQNFEKRVRNRDIFLNTYVSSSMVLNISSQGPPGIIFGQAGAQSENMLIKGPSRSKDLS